MKYIRTFKYNEDSLFEVIEEYEETVECKLPNCKNGYIIISKSDIIAQADTIEELCDEFVCVSKDNPKDYIIDDNLWGDVYPYYNPEKDYLFGAIITDKGLIYVAKMDENGKLVLI